MCRSCLLCSAQKPRSSPLAIVHPTSRGAWSRDGYLWPRRACGSCLCICSMAWVYSNEQNSVRCEGEGVRDGRPIDSLNTRHHALPSQAVMSPSKTRFQNPDDPLISPNINTHTQVADSFLYKSTPLLGAQAIPLRSKWRPSTLPLKNCSGRRPRSWRMSWRSRR